MAHVVTPFARLRKKQDETPSAARHRRDGWFDEQDNWHDAESLSAVTADTAVRR